MSSEVLPIGKFVAGIKNEIHSTRSFHSLGTLAGSLFRHSVPYGMTGVGNNTVINIDNER